MALKYGAYSHRGKVRERNEDSYYIPSCKYKIDGLFMVADGMGGHRAGDVASKMVVGEITSYFKQHLDNIATIEDVRDIMHQSIEKANKVVYDYSLMDEKYEGMGTTLTMAYFFDGKVCIAHVGDSRGYLFRDQTVNQITRDHSLVQELLENGSITREEMDHHPQKNVITRALGTDKDVEIDYYQIDLKDGDIILLCTDGLIAHVDIEYVGNSITLTDCDADDLAKALVRKALEGGGIDNITVIIVKYDKVAEER